MFVIAPDLRSIEKPDGAAVLDLDHDLIHPFNSTGGYVWQKLKEGLTVSQISKEIAESTKTDPANVESDILEFLQELTNRDLLLPQRS